MSAWPTMATWSSRTRTSLIYTQKEKTILRSPPSVMARAMLCATHDRTSDTETSRRTRVDSDWEAAMGMDDWFEGIVATTFSLMRARTVAHDADGALFKKTLERAVGAGIFKQPLTAVIDSLPGAASGAVASPSGRPVTEVSRLERRVAVTPSWRARRLWRSGG